MAGKLFDGITRYDESFYASLAHMVNEEPVQKRDLVAMGQLRSVGIEKGKNFKPGVVPNAVLKSAVDEARAGFIQALGNGEPCWPGSNWTLLEALGPKTGFSSQTADYLGLDSRGMIYFLAYAPPAKLGAATFYLVGVHDAEGNQLEGGSAYHLHVHQMCLHSNSGR
jgi:hypothetical protein